jgi:hypothetical protein
MAAGAIDHLAGFGHSRETLSTQRMVCAPSRCGGSPLDCSFVRLKGRKSGKITFSLGLTNASVEPFVSLFMLSTN